ncbi:MAG: alpha/beta hydrolase [Leptolyngbyaceae cyanobacterium]
MRYTSIALFAHHSTGDRPSRQRVTWRHPALALSGLLLGVGSVFLPFSNASALEEVRLSYRGFQFGSLLVSDLATFSETGQPSQNLEAFLNVIDVDEATAIDALTTQVAVDSSLLSEASQTFVGESFFQLLGTTIKMTDSSSSPSWVYLRDAVIASASDNQVSALEVLQAFPTNAIVLETDKIGPVIEQIESDSSVLEAFLAEGFLEESD